MPLNLSLQSGPNSSVALYLGGDLQFDSRDEQVYHEALALPALALALARTARRLDVLICGGGDGLALREVLKSDRVATVELVDYDAEMLRLARHELATLNGQAFADTRVTAVVDDARAYAATRLAEGRRYDVILCDLTWPETPAEAIFHTTHWYAILKNLLASTGVLALNAASPQATPEAFWAMVNGLRHVGLFPRPYRIALPSFHAQGYGDDWGMVLAGAQPLLSEHFADTLLLPGPRRALQDAAQMRRLFQFPISHAPLAASLAPAGSAPGDESYLFELLRNPRASIAPGTEWNTLLANLEAGSGPPPKSPELIPEALRQVLALAPTGEMEREGLLDRVLSLMPGLQRDSTRQMISTFLEAPGRFLAALDLGGLVERLIARAAELPPLFVAELRVLRDALNNPGKHIESIATLGWRVLTVVTVVVILGNLAFPDSVFGKGAAAGGGHSGSFLHASSGARSAFEPPSIAYHGGFRTPVIGRGRAVDEMGFMYPMPRYRIYRFRHGVRQDALAADGAAGGWTANDLDVVYRLTPEVGMLADGRLVMDLDDKSFFMLGAGPLSLYDRDSGQPVLTVGPQAALTWRITHELVRQRLGLEDSAWRKQSWNEWMDWLDFMPGVGEDALELTQIQTMVKRFNKAIAALPPTNDAVPLPAPPPVPGSAELFNGAWVLPEGNALAVNGEDGQWIYLDPARGWFRDANLRMQVNQPYSPALKRVITSHLAKQVADRKGSWEGLNHDISDLKRTLDELRQDEGTYLTIERTEGPGQTVDYGSQQLACHDALLTTQKNIATTSQSLVELQNQAAKFPEVSGLYQRLLTNFTVAGAKP